MEFPTLSRVAVIGAGTQGPQIAYRCILAGRSVRLHDAFDSRSSEALAKIESWFDERVGDGRLAATHAASCLARLKLSRTLARCVADADIVVEAVPEKLTLKQAVWAEIDSLAPTSALLTTNSSSLLSSVIGCDVKRKDRTFNINFGQPLEHDQVEVMWNGYTSEITKGTVVNFLIEVGFIPIVTQKEIMGFSINRTWRAIKKEVLRLVDEGYVDYQDVDRGFILEFGLKRGPFQMMDEIGLDVIRDIELCYFDATGDELDKPPRLLEDLVARGDLGVKSGRGFYRYPNPEFERDGWLEKRDLR